uniref:Uncharacterized protein n=1 Tax=Oryza nivara TaxID=4536 RepID=A0A0E0FJF7_ORYNI
MFWSRFAGSPSVQARVFAIVRHQAPPFCAASAVGDITRFVVLYMVCAVLPSVLGSLWGCAWVPVYQRS